MQHDERRCNTDAVLGDRNSNNTDAVEELVGLMQSKIKVIEARAV